ncbi:MAG: T9SS type A sorting domain-containing protein [Ignavibacteriaceae bacterium]|nr:T9SS type A sorting domain-containing protein [Ignavibacteriaceae bacterium]
MKKLCTLIPFLLIFISVVFAQDRPKMTFAELLYAAEQNPALKFQARDAASEQNLPWSIFIPNEVFIEALAVEKGNPVYSVIVDFINPYNGGYTAFYEEIISKYDLVKAKVNYGHGRIINETLGSPRIIESPEAVSFLLFVESTNDKVWALDAVTGDVINASYIPPDAVNLSTPIQARLTPAGKITISDQLTDGVYLYDTTGTALGIFAPAGGVNTSILDNVRGHIYRGNDLLVTVASGTNADCIARFDASGNYTGNFIAIGAGGLDGPWDILFRTSDVLVSTDASDAIHRYDLNGTYLDNFYVGPSTSAFFEQMVELSNLNIAVADFGVGGGIRVLSPTGTLITVLGFVTANRGVYALPNGNYLTTNAAGLFEVNPVDGDTVRQIISGVAGRFISPFDRSIIPVELTSFSASVLDGQVQLVWKTATEKNNSGFVIERSTNNLSYERIGFVEGMGTTTQTTSYSFFDKSALSGKYYYRLKQVDYNGAFEYSNVVEVDLGIPQKFELMQNYPNPFNPSTVITYTLSANSLVTLKVYDVLGNEVSALVNQFQPAGSYQVTLNANNLADGVYFYTLTTDNFTSTKKMILLK